MSGTLLDPQALATLSERTLARAHRESGERATRYADLADIARGQTSALAAELERRGGLWALDPQEESS